MQYVVYHLNFIFYIWFYRQVVLAFLHVHMYFPVLLLALYLMGMVKTHLINFSYLRTVIWHMVWAYRCNLWRKCGGLYGGEMGGKEEHVSCDALMSSFFAMYIFLYPLISLPCILLYPYLNPLISWPCIFLYPGHLHPMIQLYGPHTMHAHGTWYNPIKLSNFLRLVRGGCGGSSYLCAHWS